MGQGDTVRNAPGCRPSSTEAFPAIDAHDLSKQFGALTAVDHLSLRVEKGEIFGLLGPNGSGNTTSGTVTVMGYDVHLAAQEIRKLLGSVPQETALYEEISAQANLSFHGDVFGIPRRQKQARIAHSLRAFLLSRITCFAVCGGEVGKVVARTPHAPAGGLAALLHHLHFQHHGKTEAR